MVVFGPTSFAVPVLAGINELNGSEIGGRKIVVNKAVGNESGNNVGMAIAKGVKEVMDVYDRMELKSLVIDNHGIKEVMYVLDKMATANETSDPIAAVDVIMK